MELRHQVIVIGGGPAGLNAAKYAANAGCNVALLDSAPRLGGQYWRHTGIESDDQSRHRNFDQGSLLMDAVIANPRITIYPNTTIWSASVINGEVVLRYKDGAFITSRLILATGAYDRSLPFPGWDIPGVMTAGAAQSLLKGSGVIAGKRIVVAGSGPFLLPVAAGLSSHGGKVVGLIEAAGKFAWLPEILSLLQNPAKISEGLGYLLTLRKAKVEMRFKQAVISAHADSDGLLESITVANIDAEFHITSTYSINCDVAAIGWGFTPDTSMAGALGLKEEVAADGSVVVAVDENQRASSAHSELHIFAAGEITGIGGSALSLAEGAIAGLAAADSRTNLRDLKKIRRKARRFALTLQRVYPIALGWKSWLTPETIICRCEEVTHAAIQSAFTELDADDARSAKLMTRCGMGMCQGRICSRNVADLLDSPDTDRIKGVYRPIISPITLGELAQDGLL